MDPKLLDKFRTSLKATLWGWALYWPGGGILLLYGGLDPLSLAVVVAGVVGFLVLMLSGALATTSSRNVRELLVERPLYLLGALVLLVVLVPFTTMAEDVGLILFSTAYFGAALLALARLGRVHQAIGGSPYQARTDQAFIALGLGALLSGLLFFDAWLGLGDSRLPMASSWIAAANWMSIAYPAILLLGTRGLRERLHSPVRPVRDGAHALASPKGTPSASAADE